MISDLNSSKRYSDRLSSIGVGVLRYGVVFILLFFGAAKWTAAEAAGIQPMAGNSPLFRWLYHVASLQHVSEIIGVAEVTIALLIVVRRWCPRVSALGSVLGVGMFLATLSFLFTTPHLDDNGKGFLLKDIFLLGGCLVTAGEAFRAAALRRSAAPATGTAAGLPA